MSNRELKRSLQQLRSELEALPADAVEVRAKVTKLIADIERQLDDMQSGIEEGPLSDLVPNLIGQFEAEHPELTAALNRIMVALSDLGI